MHFNNPTMKLLLMNYGRMKALLLAMFFMGVASELVAQNLQLAANLSYGSTPLANIGGYVDSLEIGRAHV